MKNVKYPNTNVVLRNLNKEFPIISHGQGVYLYDHNGKKYFDGSSGAFVVSLGHSHPKVLEKLKPALQKCTYVNGTQFSNEPTEKCATLLSELSKDLGLSQISFLSSGSEATEAALKAATQIQQARGEKQRVHFIARSPSYHGNTLLALSASGRPSYKKAFQHLLTPFFTLSTPYEYRPLKTPYENSTQGYLDELENLLKKNNPKEFCAFILEPISGSSSAGAPPPQNYLSEIQKLCSHYGILTIADEVLCGAGRTGKFFASSHYGFKPDILTLGKGINGGYAPLSAVLFKESDIHLLHKSYGGLSHAQTYMQHPFSTAVGCAVLETMLEEKVLENVIQNENNFFSQIKSLLSDHPNVGSITGKGFLLGIEFIEDKTTKKPFDRKKFLSEKLTEFCFENGLIVWPNTMHVDNINGDLILLAPPLISTKNECEELGLLTEKCIRSFFTQWS